MPQFVSWQSDWRSTRTFPANRRNELAHLFMSIILAIVSETSGLVASDGRVITYNLSGAAAPYISSDIHNKTFEAMGGRLIGASAGLSNFANKDTEAHITECIDGLDPAPQSLDDLSARFEIEF